MYTPVTNKPTRENPGIFTFDYGEDLIDVYSLIYIQHMEMTKALKLQKYYIGMIVVKLGKIF